MVPVCDCIIGRLVDPILARASLPRAVRRDVRVSLGVPR